MAAAVIFFGKVMPKSIIISGITFLFFYISMPPPNMASIFFVSCLK